jgi:hypothetical protein
MSRRGLTPKERQEQEEREKEREERQTRVEQLQRERLERRINRELQRGVPREIPKEIPIVTNPTFSPSPEQLKSPLYFTNLSVTGKGNEFVSSPGIPNPQNSPEESGQPPPSFLQTPPVTSFFTPFSSRIERAVQQIVSPNKEKLDRTSKDGDGLETLSGVELRNLSNIEEPLENLSFLEGTSIRNLFPNSSPLTPFDSQFFTSKRVHDIGRPIEESLTSPTNRFLLTSTPQSIRQLNELNFGRGGSESNEGLLILEKLQRERLQSSKFVLPLPDIQNNEPGNQNINDGLISHKADTLLPFGTSLPPIITSDSRVGNE